MPHTLNMEKDTSKMKCISIKDRLFHPKRGGTYRVIDTISVKCDELWSVGRFLYECEHTGKTYSRVRNNFKSFWRMEKQKGLSYEVIYSTYLDERDCVILDLEYTGENYYLPKTFRSYLRANQFFKQNRPSARLNVLFNGKVIFTKD